MTFSMEFDAFWADFGSNSSSVWEEFSASLFLFLSSFWIVSGPNLSKDWKSEVERCVKILKDEGF